eukprot:CAMPEP_0170067926 /NCGR_PEP_ID=MMETSP0019_2-20121128/7076_1 /TAXON_ID=98059 /ORGANISM="Dinobryon sp., Strain UTEXLB2267" /LENGTH=197 /DNA_ID=CAMNT_0010275409 /DNA_START=1469 /DNA_END=2062 /DNA_ORIENTATION=-
MIDSPSDKQTFHSYKEEKMGCIACFMGKLAQLLHSHRIPSAVLQILLDACQSMVSLVASEVKGIVLMNTRDISSNNLNDWALIMLVTNISLTCAKNVRSILRFALPSSMHSTIDPALLERCQQILTQLESCATRAPLQLSWRLKSILCDILHNLPAAYVTGQSRLSSLRFSRIQLLAAKSSQDGDDFNLKALIANLK